MKPVVDFMKTTIVGGLLFLVPAVLIILLVKNALGFATKILKPIEKLLPIEDMAGVAVEHLLAVVSILLVCFLAGLAARTRLGARISAAFERAIARKIPGFGLIKSATGEVANIQSQSDICVALARIEDAWVLSFIVEKLDNGLLVVFVPSAPTPFAGSVYYLTEDRVKRLDAPVLTGMKVITRLGVGSKELLQSYPNLEITSS
ncbi:MAG TPA: DUF502 domain-containing protein [Thermodesulfobacteriota bacterium]|nr:DUF502 domain-containing protein [Thermodesulfobacteriota bacterium]